jgi:hypothetical protein
MLRRGVAVGLAGAVTLGVLVFDARADIALLAVRPAVARVGQVVEVRAGAYKSFAPMPLYLLVGRLDFRRHPRDVRLVFRVPRVVPGV